MRDGVSHSDENSDFDEAQWKAFESRLDYLQGDFSDPQTYQRLSERLELIPSPAGANRLFYFATGNTLFEHVWNRNHVDLVQITAAEPLGVGHE